MVDTTFLFIVMLLVDKNYIEMAEAQWKLASCE